MTFSSQLDARQFLIDKITVEAGLMGVALSDAEARLLQLNLDEPGSAIGIPVEVLQDTSRTHEKKIIGLLRSAYHRERDNPAERQQYKDAIRRLKDSDHYILIIATAAIPQKRPLGSYAVYIIIILAMAAMILALQFWTKAK